MEQFSKLTSPAIFLERINDAFFELDKDWKFNYLNHAAEKLLFKSKNDLLGVKIWDAFPEAVGSTFHTNYQEAVSRNQEVVFEEYFPPLETWFFVKAYPIESGGLWVFFSNINQLKETETKLKESEQNFRHFFEQMTLGVVYQDDQKRIISANTAAEEILGLSLDEMAGRVSADPRWRSMDEHGDDLPPEQHPAVRALESGLPVKNFQMQVYNPKNNEHRWILIDAVPQYREGETKPFQVFSLFRDITDRQRALSDREEMMHIITHDLRNPIKSAQVLFEMIREKIDNKQHGIAQEMQYLQKSLQRALQLTEDYVDSVRLDREKNRLKVSAVPLPELVQDISDVQAPLVRSEGLEWRMTTQHLEQVEIVGDVPRLKQVFENLIGNAIKFTDSPGRISLDVKLEAEYVVFDVEDTGKGIDAVNLKKIFNKFWQPDDKKKGAGLGLYIVKQIVEAHGGTIEVRSEPGVGTTFTVRLPRSEPSARL